jgi:hypothetical protein
MLFEGLPEHIAPHRARRKSPLRQPVAAVRERQVAPFLSVESRQYKLPFPRAREVAGKFLRDALHEGMKDAAKKIVVTAILASPVVVGHLKYGILGWKAEREVPKVTTPWQTSVTPANRPNTLRP